MAGLECWGVSQCHEARLVTGTTLEWCREDCLVVADIEPIQYFGNNPGSALIQHGTPFGT